MQNFQAILIAIGILAIAGVLIHGFLLSKKEQESMLSEQYEDLTEHDDHADNDEEPYVTTIESDVDAMAFYGTSSEEEKDEIETFDFSLSEEIAEEEEDNLEADITLSTDTLLTDNDVAEHHLEDVQVTTNTHDVVTSTEPDEFAIIEATAVSNDDRPPVNEPTDLFVFNVVAKDGAKLGGHELLQFFLTSGFRYGHMNIFHRHEHSDGTGEVLFSIANMMAPGTFDLDTMEQFQSQGISFFLTAPNDNIDIKKAFDLMLRAVVQIADEFHCDVLNEERGTLTEAQFIEYRSRLLKYT